MLMSMYFLRSCYNMFSAIKELRIYKGKGRIFKLWFNIQYENFGTGIQRQHDSWETVHALSPDLSSKLTPTLDNGKLVNKLIYVLQFAFLWNQRDFKPNLTE